MELTFGSETGSCSDDSLTSPAGGGPPRTRSVNVGVAGETPKEVWELSPRDTSPAAAGALGHAAAAAAAASAAAAAGGAALFLKLGTVREEDGTKEAESQPRAKRRRTAEDGASASAGAGSPPAGAASWGASRPRGNTPLPRLGAPPEPGAARELGERCADGSALASSGPPLQSSGLSDGLSDLELAQASLASRGRHSSIAA